MIEITLVGTGSPIPDPNRAGPSTVVRAGGQVFLVDCGRGPIELGDDLHRVEVQPRRD